MSEFAEINTPSVHPQDFWGQPEQAERAEAMRTHLHDREYPFMRDAGVWADLLLDQESEPYESMPQTVPLPRDTRPPSRRRPKSHLSLHRPHPPHPPIPPA